MIDSGMNDSAISAILSISGRFSFFRDSCSKIVHYDLQFLSVLKLLLCIRSGKCIRKQHVHDVTHRFTFFGILTGLKLPTALYGTGSLVSGLVFSAGAPEQVPAENRLRTVKADRNTRFLSVNLLPCTLLISV